MSARDASTQESDGPTRRRVIVGMAGAAIAGGAAVWPEGASLGGPPTVRSPRGPLLWSAEVTHASDEVFGPAAAGRLLVGEGRAAPGEEGTTVALTCLDATTGRRLWSRAFGRSPARLLKVVVSGSVALARTQTALHAFDLHTGRALWRHDRNLKSSRSLSLTAGGGLVHDIGTEENASTAASSRHSLYAYEVETGRLRWTTAVEPRAVSPDPLVRAGNLLIGTAGISTGSLRTETSVYAVDAATGEQRWMRRLGVQHAGADTGVAYAAGTFFVFSRNAGVLHAVSTSTGAIRWQVRLKPQGVSDLPPEKEVLETGVPVVAGGIVYVTDREGVLHGCDVRSGRQRWVFGLKRRLSAARLVAGPSTVEGLVYLLARPAGSGTKETLFAMDFRRKGIRWRSVVDRSQSGPILAAGALYVSDGDVLTARDPIDGTPGRRVDLRPLGGGVSTELATDGERIYALFRGQVLALRVDD